MLAVASSGHGGPEVLTVSELPDAVAGPGELLIRVVAAGVNRADLLQRRGHYSPPPGASEVLGLECSGRIAALGEGVSGWSVGDPCVALLSGGGYAELVAVPAGQVLRPPDGVDLIAAGGLVEVAATVVSNLDLVWLRNGETLLVHGGAGGIGSFAIPYAKALGARVATTAGSAEKLAHCRAIGADLAVSYRGDWAAEVLDWNRAGVDVILDVMGAAYLGANLGLLTAGGRLVVIGLQGGTVGELDLGLLLRRRAHVLGTTLRARPPAEKAAICCRVAETAWPLVESGTIPLPPQTSFPLAEVSAAHRYLETGRHLGKVVLTL